MDSVNRLHEWLDPDDRTLYADHVAVGVSRTGEVIDALALSLTVAGPDGQPLNVVARFDLDEVEGFQAALRRAAYLVSEQVDPTRG